MEGDGTLGHWEGGSMLWMFWGERSGRGSDRARRAAARGRTARRGHRPGLEGLEVRIAPAIDTWTGAVSTAWTNPGNWTAGVAPKTGDDLIFPAGAGNQSNTNDFPVGTTFRSITIQGPGYSLAGNSLDLTSGI